MEWLFFPCALLCGFGLDLILGDPPHWPHPVRGMGKLITYGERWLRGERQPKNTLTGTGVVQAEDETANEQWRKDAPAGLSALMNSQVQGLSVDKCIESELTGGVVRTEDETANEQWRKDAPDPDLANRDRLKGVVLVVIVVGAAALASAGVLWLCFIIHTWFAFATAVVMCWQCISVRCLAMEAMKVFVSLNSSNLKDARAKLSMIVGRDVDGLDEEGVCRAAIETVAENTADGVVAPMFFLAIGGPCIGMAYKAVSTLDSMIGYKNECYLMFGGAAARLDDLAAYLPSRLAALCMIAASRILGQDGRGAMRVWLRDKRKHASPNSAQCEAALAGALGVALAGDASYSGKIVHKPVIGDAGRPVAPKDIKTAVRLLYGTSLFFLPVAFMISAGISALAFHIYEVL